MEKTIDGEADEKGHTPNPHKFPKYKIKSPSIGKYQCFQTNSSLIKNICNTSHIETHRKSKKSIDYWRKTKDPHKFPKSFSFRTSHDHTNNTYDKNALVSKLNVLDRQIVSRPYLNLDRNKQFISSKAKQIFIKEDGSENCCPSFTILQNLQNQQGTKALINQKEPKRPTFLQKSQKKLNKIKVKMQMQIQNGQKDNFNKKRTHNSTRSVFESPQFLEDFLQQSSLKHSINQQSILSEPSLVIATYRELTDENGWLPLSLTQAGLIK